MANATSSSSTAITIDLDVDSVLSKSEFLTREEVLIRRSRRAKKLANIYRDHYWALMEELKVKYREYYWEYGKSAFQGDEDKENNNNDNNKNSNGDNGNDGAANRCGVHGCKAKAMALTKFCHMHVLSDAQQTLYKACDYAIKSSPTGPILCGKPILRSTVPSLCTPHFQKAEKHVARALKKAGLSVTSTSKLAPKVHIIAVEYVRQIQVKRRAAHNATIDNSESKGDSSS